MSLVVGEAIVSPDLHKVETGVESSVKIGRKIWPGRVAAVGKCVVLYVTCNILVMQVKP